MGRNSKGQEIGGMRQDMEILPEWERIDPLQLQGTLLVVGAPDVGKSTFARYLYRQLQNAGRRAAYLDGDPGQGRLGPPATMTMTTGSMLDSPFQLEEPAWRSFVGSTTPARHMLPVIVGAARLIKAAHDAGSEVVVYDTTGLIDPTRGGTHLKLAKINLLRPSILFAIQRDRELEALLRPLRQSRRVKVIEMPLSPSAESRDLLNRQAFRSEKFAHYFTGARSKRLSWAHLAVFPTPAFKLNLIVAMEDVNGYVLGLGIIQQIMGESREVTLLTPLPSLEGVDSIALGDVVLDPQTFFDQPVTAE
jgi:polynucleotide 5'-hydroxyl-kinase GRC3/NOL9